MKIKRIFACQIALISTLFTSKTSAGIVLLDGVSYTQDFNTLPYGGFPYQKIDLPAYWTFEESGYYADSIFAGSIGMFGSQDTYSFGSNSQATRRDRAFGGISGNNVSSIIGAKFTNSVGVGTIDLSIIYTGELWTVENTYETRLDFQYSTDSTSLISGTWIDCDLLDFTTPVGSFGANGNDPTNRTTLAANINSIDIPNGESFWIRWKFGGTGRAGLGVDDFTITAIPEVSSSLLTGLGIVFYTLRRRVR